MLRALLAWLCLALPLAAGAVDPVAVPALQARVTDLTGTLDATQRGRLEAQLAAIERAGRGQVGVLLLPTTQPETIEQYGIRVAEAWKLGRKGVDDGIIIIVAKDDRRMRIEVGYGLEGRLPDALASRIVNERMAPAFRQRDFFGGLQAAVAAIDQVLGGNGEPLPSPPVATSGSGGEQPDWIQWLFLLVMGAGVLRAIFGLVGSLAAAAIGGWLGFAIFGSMVAGIIAAVVVFVFSFLNVLSGGRGGGISGGGGFSGGGGGFSGGGGGFGGGGASGRW